MTTDQTADRKIPVALRLPRTLVQFLDQRAQERFTTRNEVLQGLVVEAFNASKAADAQVSA